MCDVPSIAVFCSESIECFPGTASKFFLKLLITVPVAPIITDIIVYFRFHIIIIIIIIDIFSCKKYSILVQDIRFLFVLFLERIIICHWIYRDDFRNRFLCRLLNFLQLPVESIMLSNVSNFLSFACFTSFPYKTTSVFDCSELSALFMHSYIHWQCLVFWYLELAVL